MIAFLNPALLFTAAGISIPVLIHLWNVRQGKTLKVGSVSLISDQSSQAKKVRISEWLLLVIRCLLILLAAVLLAGPTWKKTSGAQKGWVLIEPAAFKTAYARYRENIDSLLTAGYELHAFDTTFRKMTVEEAANIRDTTFSSSYTSLLNLLNERLPAGFPVQLFSSSETGKFAGTHRNLNLNLTWKRFAADTTAIRRAGWLTFSDSLRLVTEKSTAAGIAVTVKTVSRDSLQLPGLRADTTRLVIGIAAGQNIADARYLSAALSSIRQYTRRALTIRMIADETAPPANLSWLFWLSDRPAPARTGTAGTRLFAYLPGAARTVNTELLGTDKPVALTRITTAVPAGIPIWTTAAGEPVLAQQTESGRTTYRFASRFRPDWNGLAWSPAFPELLFDLILPAGPETVRDLRSYPAPYQAGFSAGIRRGGIMEHIPLTSTVWFLLMALFGLERWLSYKRSA